jgi:hypothetical protein
MYSSLVPPLRVATVSVLNGASFGHSSGVEPTSTGGTVDEVEVRVEVVEVRVEVVEANVAGVVYGPAVLGAAPRRATREACPLMAEAAAGKGTANTLTSAKTRPEAAACRPVARRCLRQTVVYRGDVERLRIRRSSPLGD